MIELVDTHCHLTFSPLAENLLEVLARAKWQGVSKIIVPAYDLSSWDQVSRVARRQGVCPAFGLHPWMAHEPLDPAALAARLASDGAVAVGEIGLDFKIDDVDRDRQIEILKLQLDVAVKLDLPVLLHCRGAFEELLEVLEQYVPLLMGVVHAFSRGPELMQRFLDLGLFIAFGGAITRPRAKRAKKSAVKAPLERILLETDAPSIGLDQVLPEHTEPKHVADIANALAELRGVDVTEIAKQTTDNAGRLFRAC